MRTLTTNNAAEVGGPITRPVWLVEIAFSTALRLSSRENITIGLDTFSAANLEVDISGRRIRVYNEDLQWSASFLGGAAETGIKIWKAWGEGPFDAADLDLWFDGQLGNGTVGVTIEFRLRDSGPRQSPRITASPPTFNHLPPDGTEILTPSGVRILQRA